MRTFLLVATYLVGFGELLLGVYFWATNSKSEIRRVMAILAFSTGAWCIATAMTGYTNPSVITAIMAPWVFIFGVFLTTSLFHFAVAFPYKIFRFDVLHIILLYLPAVLFGVIALSTNTVIADYFVAPDNQGIVGKGSLYWLYNAYLTLLYVCTLVLLIIKWGKTQGTFQKNIAWVLWSFVLGGLPAVVLALVLPVLGNIQANGFVGNISTVIWLGMTSYIVVRK